MASLRDRFAAERPGAFFLDAKRPAELEAYLAERELLSGGERVAAAANAGDGNMNCTLRVRLKSESVDRSIIVKQSRGWVEKYPQIEAPAERVLSEAQFYRLISPCQAIAAGMPRLLDLDAEAHVMALEDIGRACDFAGVYRGEELPAASVMALAKWLSDLHHWRPSDAARGALENRGMRRLNHTHIFELPLQPDNGLDLDAITPGLAEAARGHQERDSFRRVAAELGAAYLADGPCLLHGDFYPGSWLNTPDGPTVIDPEFSFFGRPEFDAGVLLAHLHLGNQPKEVFDAVKAAYRPPAGFDWSVAKGYAACEITRRLIGVAQLPLTCGLDRKRELLELSCELALPLSGGDGRASAG